MGRSSKRLRVVLPCLSVVLLCTAGAHEASADKLLKSVTTYGGGFCTPGAPANEVKTTAKIDYDTHIQGVDISANVDLEIVSRVDGGIAEARDAYPIHRGRQPTCAELQWAAGKDLEVVLRKAACAPDSHARPTKWCALAGAARDQAPTAKPVVSCTGEPMLGIPASGPGERFLWSGLHSFLRKEEIPYMTQLFNLLGIKVPVYMDDVIIEIGKRTSYDEYVPGESGDQGKVIRAAMAEQWLGWLDYTSNAINAQYPAANVKRAEVVQYIKSHPTKTISGIRLIDWYSGQAKSICMSEPWQQNVVDPFRLITDIEVDQALRNLNDKFAGRVVGTDVLCKQRDICGPLTPLIRSLWQLPNHGRAQILAIAERLVE